jgi:single-strand DNA-binding protein
MSSYNKTIMLGNLARDPESRQVGGNKVARLVVAVNDQYLKDKVSYFDVEAWGKLGELCQKYLTKGRSVLVEGRMLQDIWEKDGKKNSSVYVKADNVQFLGSPNKGDSTQEQTANTGGEDVPF